jgi:excisionase family DNA binding protein
MSDRLMTVDEVARELRVNSRKVYQFIQSGELIATNIGTEGRKIFRIARLDFETFLESRKLKRNEPLSGK